MDAPVPLILCALLAAAAIVAPDPRGRAWGMLGALVLSTAVLGAHVWDNSALRPLRDHPPVLGVAVVLAVAGLVILARAFDRRPELFPLTAVAALPFRVPIESGGSTSNLLVPLYVVIGAAALAYVLPRLRGASTPEEHEPRWLERVLALAVVLYAVQATYSEDFDRALENVVFFYVPFTLLFVLLGRVRWTTDLARRCLLVLGVLALAFAGVGFVEYATRHLFLNPKVIASNELAPYFRVNSLFFDPNIYGRFLAIVMIAVAATVIWARRTRDVWMGAGLLAVLWAGLVLTLSQSSFVALLVGLAVIGGCRWSTRRALGIAGALLIVGVVFVAVAPSAVRVDVGDSKSADSATSGRYDLIKGGVELFKDAPLAGKGAGGFSREYRRSEKASSARAASASHTIPVTVSAEQGLVGLAVYLALLVLAFQRLSSGASVWLPRAALLAMFSAVFVHSLMYAAFLEDPLTWALLGAGVAFARLSPEADGSSAAGAPDPAPA